MTTTKKPPLKTRLLKHTLTLLAISALLLQISSPIFSFRIVLRTPTRILQLGTSGGNLCLVYTNFPNSEALDSAYRVWWDADSHNFLSLNFMPPHLTLQDYVHFPATDSAPSEFQDLSDSINPNILVTEWKTAGFHRAVYGIIPANFPNDKVPQSLTELDTWWLTPLWLILPLAAIRRRLRNHTIRVSIRLFCSIALTTAACASLVLAIAIAIFWFLGLSRGQDFKLLNNYKISPLKVRIFAAESFPGLICFGVFTNGGEPSLRQMRYESVALPADIRTTIDSEFDAARHLEPHSLVLCSPFFKFEKGPDFTFLYFRPWLLQILTLIAPATWLLLYLKRKSRNHLSNHPLCPKCSYDLHAHNPGDRCPECGTAINPAGKLEAPRAP